MKQTTDRLSGSPLACSALLGIALWLAAAGAASQPAKPTSHPLDEPPPPPDGEPAMTLIDLSEELGPAPPPPPKLDESKPAPKKASKRKPKRAKRARSKPRRPADDRHQRRQVAPECVDACTARGRCTAKGGRCFATRSEDCEQSELCAETGRCTAVDNICVATSQAQCMASEECTTDARCVLDAKDERCSDAGPRRSTAALAGGIVMTCIGGVVALGGATALALARRDDDQQRNGGIAIGVGATLVGGGIPLIVWGKHRDKPDELASPSRATLRLGPGSASFGMTF
ncbi:MAG: hypothetical protein JRI68_20550 [Deltaproteobacteria bacterium]|nr:hypothetical protein [Deltaproteobacteria bacterium]